VPSPAAQVCGLDLGESQTAPLRQLAAVRSGKLPGQHDLLAVLVGANDVRTQFAVGAVVCADDLLSSEDRVAEEGVGWAWHGAPPCSDLPAGCGLAEITGNKRGKPGVTAREDSLLSSPY